MSSHHIVREKQEPALLILEIDGFDIEHLGQLLEWSPTVIVTQNMYHQVELLGIKIDALVYNKREIIFGQENIKYILNDGRETLLETALNYLITESYPAVNIICNSFNFPCYTAFVNKIDLAVFADKSKHYPIKTGFSKWATAKTVIKVYGETTAHCGLIKTNQFEFETANDGFFSFFFNQKFLFLAESL